MKKLLMACLLLTACRHESHTMYVWEPDPESGIIYLIKIEGEGKNEEYTIVDSSSLKEPD